MAIIRSLGPYLLLAGLAAAEPGFVGYGGPDGSRVFPGAAPTAFDHVTGEGVAWETPLPSWGHGSPVAVAGRVFVLCEPGPVDCFPLLVCLDGATGAIRWQEEVVAPEQERHRAELQAWSDAHYAAIRANADKKKPEKVAEVERGAKELFARMGLHVDMFRAHTSGYARGYACFGEAYGTPVSDGERVWACTTWGSYACWDLDGRRLWATFDQRAERASGGGDDCCRWGRSPILHEGLLISDVLDRLRALDAATGRLLWSHDLDGAQDSISPPAVLTVDGEDVLLTAGPKAFRLPGGEPLEVTGWADTGMQILVKHDERDVAFFAGAGEHCAWRNKGAAAIQPPAAFRFHLQGDALHGELLWHGGGLGGKDKELWLSGPTMLYHRDRFYHHDAGLILDALSGRPLDLPRREKYQPQGVPRTHHILAIAGGHVYGLDGGIGWPTSKRYEELKGRPTATLQVTTLDGRWVADSVLLRKEPTPEQRAVHERCTGDPRVWMEGRQARFSYGMTFTFGDGRIYLRSLDSLIAVAR